MLAQLKKRLNDAAGRSEFVIAVICDIRGFSDFSTRHESPDTAMFIKRFYLKLLTDYFSDAVFAKPTGDGLLLIFKYSEQDMKSVSKSVLDACIKVMIDFPNMFKDDSMINFPTPENVGFGISRGPACCLYSGRTIIDYSGRLLNLAARLNDLARPKGIVIDGHYLEDVIPQDLRSRFSKRNVYIRGIAELDPITIFSLTPEVTIPEHALSPLSLDNWESFTRVWKVRDLLKTPDLMDITLPKEPLSTKKISVQLSWPNKKLKGRIVSMNYSPLEHFRDSAGHHIRFNVEKARARAKAAKLTGRDTVSFKVQFVPKPQKDS